MPSAVGLQGRVNTCLCLVSFAFVFPPSNYYKGLFDGAYSIVILLVTCGVWQFFVSSPSF